MALTSVKRPSANSTSGSGSSWTSPANAYSSNNQYATSVGNWAVGQNQTLDLNFSGFGFSGSDLADSDTINDIILQIERKSSVNNQCNDVTIQLMDSSGTLVGSNQATATKYTSTDTVVTYNMGSVLTAAQIKAGVQVKYKGANTNGFNNYTISIDDISLQVDFTPAPTSNYNAGSFFAFF